ncbi:unnamed protein product [Microthlaspi erraticum]|uniref:Uncharacterized protein n=1 Tax=Microthlaspi erraticum TaxID=1685480 RepID=A0A6D2IM24_9BRAS|nr:unnamed protein product [Microthlaspi erraticum]
MEEHCSVICGEWRCFSVGHWDFLVDKSLMSWVVVVFVGISLADLKKRVVTEFFPDGKSSLTVTRGNKCDDLNGNAKTGCSISVGLGSCSSRGPATVDVGSL